MVQTPQPVELNKDNVVVLDYNLLVNPTTDYTSAIEQAFGSGPSCLGVLLVKNVPGLAPRRESLLQLASTLGNLPKSTLAKAHDEVTEWVGWDHGTEVFNGRPDLAKGSFYANPLHDVPCEDQAKLAKFPGMTRPNKWLPQDLPDLEPKFKDLAQLIVRVGTLVGQQCDKYATSRDIAEYPGEHYLEQVVATSRTHKGRLLHYYPLNTLPEEYRAPGNVDNLCGWHLDNSSITGLTSAMYVREQLDPATGQLLALEQVAAPPADAGLFIRTRGGDMVKVGIPKDCLAFQIGEALQLSTQGKLRATWHCVFGGSATDLARNTLAVFMQPDWTHPSVATAHLPSFPCGCMRRTMRVRPGRGRGWQ
ncbi:hypothetical protein BCR44DRAFT_1446545 [Catenaria anguillulae PL171]|uniref:Clavaminate synthase-like protein n=1 Tax=Catenaria anguillulae PL171 TaxID=765915 RepID=A0A1Y2H695_9FUNG|nr:hypothetical protein BCR44DRAFT_1446545 [Catenaria anguillulae PL171]